MNNFTIVQPDGPLYRLARTPDPWAWPNWAYAGLDGTFGNRWASGPAYERSASVFPIIGKRSRTPNRRSVRPTRRRQRS
jgi:hypothetical protein